MSALHDAIMQALHLSRVSALRAAAGPAPVMCGPLPPKPLGAQDDWGCPGDRTTCTLTCPNLCENVVDQKLIPPIEGKQECEPVAVIIFCNNEEWTEPGLSVCKCHCFAASFIQLLTQ